MSHHRDGLQSLNDHDYDSAVYHFELAASLQPTSIDTLLGLTTAYSKQGKHAEAMRVSDRIIRLDGFNKTAWLRKAESLYSLSKYQTSSQATLREALAAVNQALRVDQSNPESWYLRGLILARMGNPDEAAKSFDGALSLDTDHADALFQRDQCRLAHGSRQADEGSARYQYRPGEGGSDRSPPPAAPASVSIPVLIIGIVCLFCIVGAAILLIGPPKPTVGELMDQGLKLEKQVRYEEAIVKFDAVIEQDQGYYSAWYHKGWCLEQMQRYEEALRALDKAIAIDPTKQYAWVDRGFSSSKMGRNEAALFSYEKAIAIDSEYGLAWYNKGCALNALGRRTEAKAAFDRAEALGYDPAKPNS